MFFKMLKSDLKQKKGLNVVLFVFMTVASILIFVGSVQVYNFFTGNTRNKEVCNISDLIMVSNTSGSLKESSRSGYDDVLSKNSHVTDYYRKEMLGLELQKLDFEYFDETIENGIQYYNHYLMTVPKENNLLFDLDDNPFYVENGTVYLAENLRTLCMADVGQKLRITTDMGNVYELTIAGFYKQPYIGYSKWYIVSDADYKLFESECFTTFDFYGIDLDEISYYVSEDIVQSLLTKAPVNASDLQDANNSDDYILGYVLAVFITLIAVFLILIIIMTIRFTMIAALKDEEKEIGMMRAMGVDSFSFRWLFAAKYIAFAVIGGIIGIIVGFPLSKSVLMMFSSSNITPDAGIMGAIGLISVVFIVAVIIAFSLSVMQRINKISVIDAIRGENRGERFGKSSSMLLHKRQIMPVPFYLAASDILKRFKRYLFLFVAYTLGVLIILITVNLRNSVISTDFMKYYLTYQMDFNINMDEKMVTDYIKRSQQENKDIWQLINEDIEKAGIPAYIDNEHYMASGKLKINGNDINMNVYYGKGDISKLSYRDGSTIPTKKDEAALSYYTASMLGIQIGDKITLSIPTYSDDGLTETYNEETFTVTAFINIMEGGTPSAILGGEYENPTNNSMWMAMIINAEGSKKEEAFAKLQELFGADKITTGQEYVEMALYEYNELFTLLEYVMGGAVICILILMTYLYSSIFIAEEKQEIALLKSMGFTDVAIKASHIFRMLILSIVSVILGEILLKTAGQAGVSVLMETLGLTGFGFLPEYLMSFIIIPVIVIGAIIVTQWLNLKNINNIAVWNISDE